MIIRLGIKTIKAFWKFSRIKAYNTANQNVFTTVHLDR